MTLGSRVYFCLNVSLPQLICAVTPPYKSTAHSRKWRLERWREPSLRLTTLQLPAGRLELEKRSRPGGDDGSRPADSGPLHSDISPPPVEPCGRSVLGCRDQPWSPPDCLGPHQTYGTPGRRMSPLTSGGLPQQPSPDLNRTRSNLITYKCQSTK